MKCHLVSVHVFVLFALLIVETSEGNEELAVGSFVGKRGILLSNITCTRSKLNRTEHT
jgi:hypothetical protein